MRRGGAGSGASMGAKDVRALIGGGLLAKPIILEIGACDGLDTLELLKVHPRATVHCFEPDDRAVRRWRQAVRSRRATLHRVAIGAEDGRAEFHPSGGQHPRRNSSITGGWYFSGSLRSPKRVLEAFPWIEFGDPIEVPVRSLDSWSEQQGLRQVDFIWADVQGAEVDLIAGGVRTLSRTRYLFTEYHDDELYEGQIRLDDILRMLPGWEVVRDFGGDVLLRNPALNP